MTFQELENTLRSAPSARVGVGATESEIGRAESELGTRITGDYRAFLAAFGWLEWEGKEVYGLGSDVPFHLNLVEITVSERGAMQPPLPHNLLPLMNDGAGNLSCLDTGSPRQEVVFWDHEDSTAQRPQVEAGTFLEWLVEKLELNPDR
ncbi:MAG: SMI1/KNR4 family protein [Polyangiaceae bacterium]|nr:SMI1/KNR4 family protein [Polyangiaceae bacterium]